MAGNKFFDFLNSLINNSTSNKNNGLDEKAIKDLKDELVAFNKVVDDNNEGLNTLNKQMEELDSRMQVMQKTGQKTANLMNEWNALEEKRNKLIEQIKESDGSYQDFLNDSSKKLNVNVDNVESTIKNLSTSTVKGKDNFKNYQKGFGDLSKDFLKNSLELGEFAEVFEGLGVLITMAVEQFIELNDKLIKFQRISSGALNARAIGFDQYGNNQTFNTGSLSTLAEKNNLSVEEFLKTFSAFSKDGQILGVTQDLQDSQDELQKYGVAIGRISKLYGVSDETLSSLSRNLSQNYGVKIKDLSDTFQEGAKTALAAGINVGKFFDNMNALAERTGDIYFKNGAKGIEETAFALSKLGLSAASIDKVNDSLKTFTDIINKQNQASALGLSNYSALQARIFAKLQTGDNAGALRLQQTSLAQDINRQGLTDRKGNINTQGILTLKAAGIGKDEIASIQRLIRGAEYAGVSLEAYADETKLSTEQLAKKRQFEQEESTWGEKLSMLWAQLKEILIDPLAEVLAPLADILINAVSYSFKLLGFALKPVILLFQGLGVILSKVAEYFSLFTNYVKNFIDKFNINFSSGLEKVKNFFFGSSKSSTSNSTFNSNSTQSSLITTLVPTFLQPLANLLLSPLKKLESWLSKIADSTEKFLGPLWNVVKFLSPLLLIWDAIKKIAQWVGVIAKDTEDTKTKEEQMKITNVVSSLPDTNKIMAVMKTREVYNTEIMRQQEKQMTKTFHQPPTVNIKTQNDLFGGYKVKAAGY